LKKTIPKLSVKKIQFMMKEKPKTEMLITKVILTLHELYPKS